MIDIHILDIIMYFPIIFITWKILPYDYKNEIGKVIGYGILVFISIIYIIIFTYWLNWSDIVIPNLNFIL